MGAPWLEPKPVQAAHGERRLGQARLALEADRGATAELAVAEAVRLQAVAAHDQRRVDLDRLDRRALDVANHRIGGVDAVLDAPPARAAGERLDGRYAPARGRGVDP